MSKEIWISSDLHLFHSNILKFTDDDGKLIRGKKFDDVQQMNDYILEMHNSVVKPGDKYYCLGDVFIGDRDEFKQLWPRFNGKKNLITGNHDDIKFLANGGFFSKIYESRDLREMGLLLTHRPAHESQLWDFKRELPMKNIHGHIHQRFVEGDSWQNVCVEVIDYKPVNIEELRIR